MTTTIYMALLLLGFNALAWLASKNPRTKALAGAFLPPLVLCGIGAICNLHVRDLAEQGLRSYKVELAFYMCSFFGVAGLVGVTIYKLVKLGSPKPTLGAQVSFRGADGKTKLTGNIVDVRDEGFVVATASGRFTLRAEHILKISKPQSSPRP